MGVNISYVQDDIVLAAVAKNANIIAHGCNCFHVMGAGVAKRLADVFPEIREADEKTPYGDINKLGSFSKVRDANGMYVYNLYTQYSYGTKDAVMVHWKSVRVALSKMINDFMENSDEFKTLSANNKPIVVVISAIGTGLAGGSMFDLGYTLEEFKELVECRNECDPDGNDINIELVIAIK